MRALQESPEAFGSTHAQELAYPDQLWQERVAIGADSEERALFIAEQEGDGVGCAGCYRGERGATPAVISMWVAPEARRQGAGRNLLDAARNWAEATGAGELLLDVVSTQEAARALYESYGFAYTGASEPGRRDPSQLLLEMSLRIS